MAIMGNALLDNVEHVAGRPNATIANLHVNSQGGQLGIGPHLEQIDASTPLVFSPAIAIVTHIPTMFRTMPHMGQILKALVERHAKTITGVDSGLELEQAPGYIQADGQEVNVPTKTKRTPIAPNMTFPEISGNYVFNFWSNYISMINQPDTHHSKLAAIVDNPDDIDPFVFSSFCFDFILINFDPTMLPDRIITANFVTCCFPRTTGMENVKREISVSETPERSIDFSGIIQRNANTYQAGVEIARALQLHKTNYDLAKPVASAISENAKDGAGIQDEIKNILNDFKFAS